jgi:glycerol-3-phosphate dehydrogenase
MKKTFRLLHSAATALSRRAITSAPPGKQRGKWTRRVTTISATTVFAATAITVATNSQKSAADETLVSIPDPSTFPRIPPRAEQIAALKRADEHFDVLIIGGGASGAGCALDAASRGLKVALVERDDFACGTSSRSTKLVHGGVRYLEKAFRVTAPLEIPLPSKF